MVSCLVSLLGEPLAWTRNVKPPLLIGVPEMTPVDVTPSPSGSAPSTTDHEPTLPPDASSDTEYALSMAPSGRPAVVTISRGAGGAGGAGGPGGAGGADPLIASLNSFWLESLLPLHPG
jgi:hypothetical protein